MHGSFYLIHGRYGANIYKECQNEPIIVSMIP